MADASELPATEEISFYIGRAYYDHIKLIEQIIRDKNLSEVLCPGMGQILFALFENDDRMISDLSKNLRLSQSHLTGMLNKMEKNELIERVRDENDKRAFRIRLTAHGRKLHQDCRDILCTTNRVMTAGFTESETIQFRNLAGRIIENIRNSRTRQG